MLGDNDIEEPKVKGSIVDEFQQYFSELEKERCICEQIYKRYGRVFKIKRIYARPKGSKHEYYQVTYERDDRG